MATSIPLRASARNEGNSRRFPETRHRKFKMDYG